MKRLLVFGLLLAFFCNSCHRSDKGSKLSEKVPTAASSEETSGGSATISASPNPVLHGTELGRTTITWNTGNSREGQVYVSENGAAEKLVASGETGTQILNWIRARSRYEFRLYEGSAHSKLLAKVEVLHQP